MTLQDNQPSHNSQNLQEGKTDLRNLDEAQNEEGFVNQGLQNWIALRNNWRSKGSPVLQQADQKTSQADVLFEELYSDKEITFSQRIPLPELVSVLVEVWESETT